ncbi:glycosyltransferase family 2 protein [Olivibacter ginsenosidimutans]
MMKKISVVIPTYKRPQLLIKCLHALHQQVLEKKYYEVIVVSDGFDAATKKLVHEMQHLFQDHLVYLHHEVRKGPAAARNLGWLFSSSPLIAFTDDDCIPDERWLLEILTHHDGKSDLVYSGTVIVPTARKPTDYEKNTAQLEQAEFITANCACTKKVLYQVGGFDERYKMAWREDSDLHFKLLQQRIPIIKLPKAVVIHPVRRAKWGVSVKEQKKGIYNALLFKKFPTLYRSKIASRTSLLYYTLLVLLLIMIYSTIVRMPLLQWYSTIFWVCLTMAFIMLRLRGTRRSLGHVTEIVVTSIVIPYLSIFWKIYGAIKFRVFMI